MLMTFLPDAHGRSKVARYGSGATTICAELAGLPGIGAGASGGRRVGEPEQRQRDVQRGSEPPRYDSAVSSSLTVRPARVEDVAQMARVNVRCWQETYRGLMSDAVLDDPGFLAARERFWTAALTDERYRENRVAVAERDGELVGIAMSGPPLDAAAAWARQLYVLYVYAADHGTGAGRALLEAVVDPGESAALWVADPNPRAQAFYRKHGFVADGTAQVEDGVREIRMVRGMQHGR
jgi:ribosomal protein S18 acetylase RimI-like enzyme